MCFVVLRMNTVFGIFITSSLIGGNVIVVLQSLKNLFYYQTNTQILDLAFSNCLYSDICSFYKFVAAFY